MNSSRLKTAPLLLSAIVVATLTACGSPPLTNAALDDARSSYQRAANDAQVAKSAPVELTKAQEALQRGDSALRAGEDPRLVDHYAYLAKRRSEVAQQIAKVAESEMAVADASTRRQTIVAESERANAEAARRLAEQRGTQASAATARARSLEQQLADLKAKQTDRGMVLTLGDVLFATGRAQLNPGAARTLDQLATFLRENPERSVMIEGYTDSTGSDQTNQVLSERRANSVKSALMDRGIAINRIAARGFGEMHPVASNNSAGGRQQNRRVEIVISNPS
ncbi:MAG: OmpA family protein [Burkholderiales bacterium]